MLPLEQKVIHRICTSSRAHFLHRVARTQCQSTRHTNVLVWQQHFVFSTFHYLCFASIRTVSYHFVLFVLFVLLFVISLCWRRLYDIFLFRFPSSHHTSLRICCIWSNKMCVSLVFSFLIASSVTHLLLFRGIWMPSQLQHIHTHIARKSDFYLCWHVIEYLYKFNSIPSWNVKLLIGKLCSTSRDINWISHTHTSRTNNKLPNWQRELHALFTFWLPKIAKLTWNTSICSDVLQLTLCHPRWTQCWFNIVE